MSSSQDKNSQIWRRESQRLTNASRAISRLMKKGLNGKKIETKRDVGSSVSGERLEAASEAREARRDYYQVEITASHRHSGGSDQYSVVEEAGPVTEEAGVTLIDMTEPIPRCVNYPGPDIIKDLPRQPRRVVRSSSFLNSSSGSVMTADIKRGLTGARGRGRGLQRSVSNVSHLSPRARPICGVRAVTGVYRDNLYPQQHVRQQQSPARLATTAPPASVNRSFSSVSDLPRTYQRNLHHRRTPHARPPGVAGLYVSPPGHQGQHTRQGSVSSTSTSSGSLGSSGFVSPNRDGAERRRPVRGPGLGLSCNSPVITTTRTHQLGQRGHSPGHLQFPSSNSAFRRPKPCSDRRKELEIYASQWQNWGNRRNIRDLDLNAVNTIKQNISPEIQDCWEPSKSLTLPRKIKTKEGDNNEDENSQSNRNFYSLPRPKTVKPCPGECSSDLPAGVSNLVKMFENRRNTRTRKSSLSSPTLKNDGCDNIIISPPLEFVDSLQTSSSFKPKSRTDFISDVLHLPGDDDLGGDLSDSDPVPGITQHLYTALLAKLVSHRERLTGLAAEYERLSRELRELDHKLISRAPYHVVDKYRVHLADTDKIVRLILSVTGRLVTINQDLDNLAWSGLEERMAMEQKKDKLLEQLEETKELWGNIERRTAVVTSHVEHYVGEGEGGALATRLRAKVRLMVEKRELEEKIDTGEKQLGAMKIIETFEVIV